MEKNILNDFDIKIDRGNNSVMVTFCGEKIVSLFVANEYVYLTQYVLKTFLSYLGQQKTLKICSLAVFIILSKLT